MVPEGMPIASQSVLFDSGGLDLGESVVFLSPIGVGEAFICKITLTVLGLTHSRDRRAQPPTSPPLLKLFTRKLVR